MAQWRHKDGVLFQFKFIVISVVVIVRETLNTNTVHVNGYLVALCCSYTSVTQSIQNSLYPFLMYVACTVQDFAKFIIQLWDLMRLSTVKLRVRYSQDTRQDTRYSGMGSLKPVPHLRSSPRCSLTRHVQAVAVITTAHWSRVSVLPEETSSRAVHTLLSLGVMLTAIVNSEVTIKLQMNWDILLMCSRVWGYLIFRCIVQYYYCNKRATWEKGNNVKWCWNMRYIKVEVRICRCVVENNNVWHSLVQVCKYVYCVISSCILVYDCMEARLRMGCTHRPANRYESFGAVYVTSDRTVCIIQHKRRIIISHRFSTARFTSSLTFVYLCLSKRIKGINKPILQPYHNLLRPTA